MRRGGACLWVGLCERSGFALVEESEADQAFEPPADAFDALGQHREIKRQTQLTGAQRPSFLLDAGQGADWAPGQSMPSMMRKSRSTPSERATSASW